MVLAQEDSENEPVMSLDYDAPQFGMGQMIYLDREDQEYLTYSKSHNYVLSQKFNSDKPELVADQLSKVSAEGTEGRDFKGQVVKTIGDKTYILIGNEQQLRKIGTDEQVNGAVYQAYLDGVVWRRDTDSNGKPIMLYSGDADLTKDQNGVADFTFGQIKKADSKYSQHNGLLTRGRCGVDQVTGEINPKLNIEDATKQKYTANANYIIFRDIDLSSEEWKPLTFQGKMIGAKAQEGESLWDSTSSQITASMKPVLSNVRVVQSSKLNVGEQMGVGFFSTISSEVSDNDIGLSKGLVQVSNIKFENITVQTSTSETYYPETLVSTLTSTLGKLLGGVLSGLTFILTFGQVKIDLGKTLGDVLDARKKDPTALATGAIAGRVEGQVELSNLEVNSATVENVNNNTGGFVGYIVGKTQYDGLSNALGGLVKLLTNILNVIPGLGLGDLITILLGNAIPLEKLIPTGYINAKIINCHVNGLSISTAADKEYAGGFIGQQKGTIVENCSISNSDYTINGKSFAGGFVGIARDDEIEGTLSGALDIETKLPKMNPESLLLNCSLNNTRMIVSGESYVGGFAGGFANSTAVNCTVEAENELTVKASGSHAGGFAGVAALGWAADIGKGDTKDNLLGGVVDLVVKLLSSNPGATSSLLSLAGVSPSYILGCTVKAPLKVSGVDYVGGIVGRGNGSSIAPSSAEYLQKVSYWRNNIYETGAIATQNVVLNGDINISGRDYVGGIAGSLGTASVAGLLNTTLGVASYLAFTVDNVSVQGNESFSVKGRERVGAGLGDAIGGSIKNVTLNNVVSVNGDNLVGGFIGLSGPGDLAGTDGGLTVNLLGLNHLLKLSNLLSLGQAVEVKIQNVQVNGVEKGFKVKATGVREENSVRDYVLGDATILGGLVDAKSALASVAEDFVPTIRNSSATCIPCGGAVRADAISTTQVQRGMAGGYAGHNEGGHIWGNNTKKWKGKKYTGPTSTCKAVRIRSVYGKEIAGGFTGLMESADTASTGNLSLLWGLVKVDNILGALSVVYPTEENTAVYGPLALMDYKNWNDWVEFVGKYKGYGSDLAEHGTVNNQTELDAIIGKYAYGYNVVAGRVNYRDEIKLANGGAAGGYVGSMQTGTITNGQAYQAKTIKGIRCAGGFAGEMINGGAAKLGGVDILGLNLQLGQMIQVLNVFVPVIKKSSVEGYQSGLRVQSNGTSKNEACGYAGGYVGKLIGGQIWGEKDARCKVTKLRRVDGRSYVGGFVGSSRPGSVATLNPTAGEGLLSQLLNKLLSKPADLIKVLNATVATIRYADVISWDDWGFIVNGAYATGAENTSYAKTAGGFAGMLEGTVLGEKDTKEAGISAQNIRSVIAGEYAGGCFGVADVAGVANISAGNETSLLDKLLKLGRTDVLDAFRSYVYYGTVNGSKDAGLSVSANTAIKSGQNNQVTYSGTAGGFGGSLLNGSVKNSKVTDLSNVRGLNSVGGFVGYSGKSGVVKADKIDVLGDNTGQLLGGALGVMDIFGSHIDDCAVTGTDDGYTVQSTNGDEQIAGGFIGYANLARMSNCTAGDKTNQKIGLKQVASGGTAGGFAGRTSFAYLADLKLDSGAVNVLFVVINRLVKALYLDKAQALDLLKINLGIIKVEALYEENLIHVNLLGLDISVGLSKKSTDNKQETDLAIITIGDSSIKLPCNENGLLNDNDAKSNISVSLIKANRTKITDSNVYGISYGYDVYAGGAGNDKDGSAEDGRSGGFVGFNDEGLLKNNNMYYCDVVRGTKDLVGPFSGISKLDSQYKFNTLEKVEGEDNNYRIYRKLEKTLDQIKKNSDRLNLSYEKDASSGWDIYTLGHMNSVKSYDTLKNAKLTDDTSSTTAELKAYESSAKAVLMSDTKTTLNTGDSDTPEPSESQDPCDEYIKLTINKIWKDLNNFDNSRPNSITVTISRTWKDKAGNETTERVPGYESYKIEGSIDKSKWQEVIKELPAYKTDGDEIYYYTYSITEAKVDGYTTTIDKSQDGFTFTITNRHFPGLPDTGGYGSYLIYLIAVLLFLVYFVMRYKKCKENKKAEKL